MAYGIGYAMTDPAGTAEQRLVEVMQHIPVLILMGVGYVAIALASGVIMRLYLMRDLWLRVAEVAPTGNLDFPLTGYRDVPGSLSKQARRMEEGMLRIIAKLGERGAWRGRRPRRPARRQRARLHRQHSHHAGW